MEIHLTHDDIMDLILEKARASGLFLDEDQIKVILAASVEDRILEATVRTTDPAREAEEPSQ